MTEDNKVQLSYCLKVQFNTSDPEEAREITQWLEEEIVLFLERDPSLPTVTITGVLR